MNNKVRINFSYKFNLNSDKICEFYKKNWDKDIILGNKIFYKWNFIENPFNLKKDYNCLALDESNNIIGIMGISLRDFFLEEKKMNDKIIYNILKDIILNKKKFDDKKKSIIELNRKISWKNQNNIIMKEFNND